MAVSSVDTLSGPYTTNGVTTTFPFTFKAMAEGEVRVFRIASTGIETEISSGSYDVTLGEDGGSVVFTVAPAAGDPLYIGTDPDFTQQITFENQGAFLPEVMNEAFDRAAIRDLAIKRDLDRAIRVPLGEESAVLPPIADRTLKYLGFDADGLPIATNAVVDLVANEALGISVGEQDMGTTPGTILSDNGTAKDWFGEAEAAIEGVDAITQAQMSLDVPGVSDQGYDFRLMQTIESIDGTDGSVGKVDALKIEHTFGGGTVKGGRHAVETFCVMIAATASDNPDRNYVGGAFTGYATASDGGTLGSERGAMFGVNGVGRLGASATGWLNVTGGEFNTEVVTGAQVHYKSGIQICGFATDTVRGTDYDAMISLSRQVGGTTWKDGILFSAANGAAPVGADSTLLRTEGAATVRSGVDLGSYLFSEQAVRVGQTSPVQAGVGIRQQANGSVGLHLQRNTDTAPTGNVIQLVNSVNSAVLFNIDASGNMGVGNVSAGLVTSTGVTSPLITNGAGVLAIGDASGEVQIRKPLVAPGGGAAAFLGSIGGSGPTTANQNSWLRLLGHDGAVFWVPAWK